MLPEGFAAMTAIRHQRTDSVRLRSIKSEPIPPFSCICTLGYYDDLILLNRPEFWLLYSSPIQGRASCAPAKERGRRGGSTPEI